MVIRRLATKYIFRMWSSRIWSRSRAATAHAHYEDFIEAEIEEFFRLRDQFLTWLSDNALNLRVLSFLEPAAINHLIAVALPSVFRKHFPNERAANSPGNRCNSFIGHVLNEAGLRDDDPTEMIVKRRARAKSRVSGANPSSNLPSRRRPRK